MRVNNLTHWLARFSGEDIAIVAKCHTGISKRFAMIGLFVLFIFCLCFLSSTYALHQLFEHRLIISIPIGLFFGWMITNIYLLLLYTLTPNVMKNEIVYSAGGFSLAYRFIFLLIISLIISKPIGVWLFCEKANEELAYHKMELRSNQVFFSDQLYINKEKKLIESWIRHNNMLADQSSKNDQLSQCLGNKLQEDSSFLFRSIRIQKQIANVRKATIRKQRIINEKIAVLDQLCNEETVSDSILQVVLLTFVSQANVDTNTISVINELIALTDAKNNAISQIDNLLGKSSFFIYKIKALSAKGALWIIDLLFLIIFFLPALLKFQLKILLPYYKQKHAIECQLVTDAYKEFKKEYSFLLKKITGKEIAFYESYIDPPFNTNRTANVIEKTKTQKDLLDILYGSK